MSSDVLFGIFATLTVLILVFGLATMVGILWCWNIIESFYPSKWFKVVGLFCRLAAICIPALAWYCTFNSDEAKENWEIILGLAIAVGWFIWEINQIIAECMFEKTSKEKIANSETQVRQVILRSKLLTMLRRLVEEKQNRVEETLKNRDAQNSINTARDALNPRYQIRQILERMATFFIAFHSNPSSEAAIHQRFRIGLYIPNDQQYLEPFDAYDTMDGNKDPFSSYVLQKEHFHLLNSTNPAEAVKCINKKQLQIIGSCEAESEDDNRSFTFLREEQRSYLKSMIAYPLFYVDTFSREKRKAALLVDTNVSNFFSEEERDIIEFTMREFAARIRLELTLLGL